MGAICSRDAASASPAAAAPSVYPTGVTIYDPARTWNGYTVLSPLATEAVLVIDMNGNVVKRWDGYNNSAGGPARVLPGGGVIAASGARPPYQESLELVQRDFAGNTVWSFRNNEQIMLRDGTTVWSSRQHHDWQREDFPAGYYSPEFTPAATGSNTLILAHTNHTLPAVADAALEDDRIIEVTPDGRIAWEWVAGEHIDELGFAADARAAIKAASTPTPRAARSTGCTSTRRRISDRTAGSTRRPALRAEQRHHQQPAGEPARDRRARRQGRLAHGPGLQRVGGAAQDSADHRPTPRSFDPERVCRAPATCSCSTTAARAATASPGRSRRTASARSRAPRRAC